MSFKRPESVLVVIYSKDGLVLMLERAEPRGFWQSVTGSLHEEESALAGARREIEEETGLKVEPVETGMSNSFPIAPAWRARYAPEVTHNHETVFALQLDSACEVHLNPAEHVAQVWLPREKAAEQASSWTNRDAILALVPAEHPG
jgi:dATP pyrophosphohydrolase